MPSLNKVQIIGHLGRDPETRSTSTGKTVCNFSVAVSDKWDGGEHTEWFNITAWNKTGEICQKYLFKGSAVYVEGRLKTREWTNNEGEKRKSTDLIASNIVLLGEKKQSRQEPLADELPDESDIPF